ncbi:MAG: NAD(P)H-hydrate dehydratase, partial [Clostridia bacterium]|nr:NAD(P)H-hydrate dehydratase [Clostridia bacterium]
QFGRISHAKELAKKYGCVVVLKGNRTVIASPDDRLCICPLGNPGMAKGGMGDLLAGMIGALAAQKIPAFDAACLGVYLHAKAGDFCCEELGEVSMLPSDVAHFIPAAIKE